MKTLNPIHNQIFPEGITYFPLCLSYAHECPHQLVQHAQPTGQQCVNDLLPLPGADTPYVDTVANLWSPAKFSKHILTAYRTGMNSDCEVAEMSLRISLAWHRRPQTHLNIGTALFHLAGICLLSAAQTASTQVELQSTLQGVSVAQV